MSKDKKKSRKESRKKSTIKRPSKLRPNPEDFIAKSKKLKEKQQGSRRNSNVTTSRSSITMRSNSNDDNSRVCANGKPMPPLSELEKMFEDSDDNEDQTKIVTPKKKKLPRNSSPIPSEKLTSPRTIKKIADKMMDMISNLSDPSTIIEDGSPPIIPPKKRKKPEVPYIVGYKERNKVPERHSTNVCKGVEIIEDIDEDECPTKRAKRTKAVNISKSIFNAKSDDIAAWLKDCENADHSNGSADSDSNKTVDYDIQKIPCPSSRPQSFSPLPSTSRDCDTINKNDQMFNESILSEASINNNQSNIENMNETNTDSISKQNDNKQTLTENLLNDTKIDDDVEIIQTPCETIVIDECIEIRKPLKRKRSDDSDILECVEIVGPDVKKESVKSTMQDNEAILIDDDDYYKFVNDSPICDEITDVIDVDNIIAENKAIIEKYSKETDNDINTVTYVDSTTISNLNQDKASKTGCNSSPGTPTIIDIQLKTNTIKDKGDNSNTKNDKRNSFKEIVTNFFTPKPSNQSCSVIDVPESASPVFHNFTEWLNNLKLKNIADTQSTSNIQNLSPDDSVILIDDVPSPVVNIAPRAPDLVSTYCALITKGIQNMISNRRTPVQNNRSINHKHKNHQSCRDCRNITNSCSQIHTDCTGGHANYRRPLGANRTNRHPHTQPSVQKPAQVPSQTLAPAPTPVTPVKNYGDCPICMDSLVNNSVASTICGHVFCMKCIEAAFKASGKRCPTCRKVLKKGGYHQLFL